MKLTYSDQQQIVQQTTGLHDSTSLVLFKRDINTGGARLQNAMDRSYNRKSRTTSLVSGTQYYQLPEDVIRVIEVVATSSSTSTWRPPLIQVPDEYTWRRMNMVNISGIPTHYFVRGFDEIGLYPNPAYSITDGLEISFEPKFNSLTEDDYTTGTVTVTQGSQTITHSATGFTQNMVGRLFSATDGSDTNWYKISAYVDSSNLTLENYYQGLSGSGKTFRIGQVMDIPEEFLEAPADYAIYRHYLRRGDTNTAGDFKAVFENALEMVKNQYGQVTSNQVITANRRLRSYNPLFDTPIRPNSWV